MPMQNAAALVDDTTMIETRFGTVRVNKDNRLRVVGGLLGFERFTDFALVELPHDAVTHFKVLQSIEDPALSFVVTPLNLASDIVDSADLDEALEGCGVDRANSLVLLVVTVRAEGEAVTMTANLRAPVIVDIEQHVARQVVMTSNRYPIRLPLAA